MGLTPRFTQNDVKKAFAQRVRAIETAILNNLIYLGELCVNQARSVNTYRDQTGNLRNSVGYVVVKNGRIVHRNFGRTATAASSPAGATGSADGLTTGEELANQLAGEYPSGFALIVVAGMHYAATVESRGLDVLSSAEHLAEQQLPILLRDLKLDIAALG